MDYNKMPTNSFDNFFLSWTPDRTNLSRPFYLSLANALESDIVSGKLAAGTRLPPQRELADFLDLNFTTVTQAYNLCREKQLIYGVVGRGTFVSPLPGNVLPGRQNSGEYIELGLVTGFDHLRTPVIEATRSVLQKGYIEELYSYTEAAGHLHQRVAGAHWMKQMDVHTDSEHIAIFSGAQNIISATLLSLFKIGDKIAVDEYTYSNLLGMARLSHIRLIPVCGDDCGICLVLEILNKIFHVCFSFRFLIFRFCFVFFGVTFFVRGFLRFGRYWFVRFEPVRVLGHTFPIPPCRVLCVPRMWWGGTCRDRFCYLLRPLWCTAASLSICCRLFRKQQYRGLRIRQC